MVIPFLPLRLNEGLNTTGKCWLLLSLNLLFENILKLGVGIFFFLQKDLILSLFNKILADCTGTPSSFKNLLSLAETITGGPELLFKIP